MHNDYPVDPDILARFGEHVREQRKVLGLSQEELADLADVHRTYVGMIEHGEKNITLRNIAKFAKDQRAKGFPTGTSAASRNVPSPNLFWFRCHEL
jgi:transcriptional regulator with XRE-family HTH domain